MILGQATVDQVEKAEREAKTFLAKVGLLHSGGPAAFVQSLSHVRLIETPWHRWAGSNTWAKEKQKNAGGDRRGERG